MRLYDRISYRLSLIYRLSWTHASPFLRPDLQQLWTSGAFTVLDSLTPTRSHRDLNLTSTVAQFAVCVYTGWCLALVFPHLCSCANICCGAILPAQHSLIPGSGSVPPTLQSWAGDQGPGSQDFDAPDRGSLSRCSV